jgi:hypothetical protein
LEENLITAQLIYSRTPFVSRFQKGKNPKSEVPSGDHLEGGAGKYECGIRIWDCGRKFFNPTSRFRIPKSSLLRIAISEDMLDTGGDFHEVVNLAFMEPVNSQNRFW